MSDEDVIELDAAVLDDATYKSLLDNWVRLEQLGIEWREALRHALTLVPNLTDDERDAWVREVVLQLETNGD